MTEQLLVGIGLVIVAGLLNGSFAAPMKPMSAWRWENSWLIFAATGLVIFPWIITFLTVPRVGQIYLQSSLPTLEKVVLFGIAWGVGSTLFGIGISRVGMALGFAIILGITASFGSFFPLAVLHPEELHTQRGIALMVGTATMIVGLLFLALAGKRRERDSGAGGTTRSGFALGLVICIFSGIFSSMLNFSFLFGDEIRIHALAAGASNSMAANPIWSLTVTGGFLSNLLYCVYLLNKNKSWGVYRRGNPSTYWLLGCLSGLLWYGGVVAYGMGAASLGKLGGIVGWPVFMTLDIIAGIFWGAVTGEWKQASRRAVAYCWAGVAVLILAIILISIGNAS
ncbi:MAG: L-rhamnose/proton symporter RhaT [Candidatus Acidiferrales bacterium]